MMKQLVAALLLAGAVLSAGCGRSADFGVVDMARVETEAVQFKTLQEEGKKELEKLQAEMEKALAGKSGDARTDVIKDFQAKVQIVQSNISSRIRTQFDGAVHQVAQEKGLGAVLMKQAVPDGGTDITDEVLKKLK